MEKRNLVQDTTLQLKQYIKRENLSPGVKLPAEKQLAEKFGVGRSTLREAVKILQYGDILEVRQGAGTFVKQREVTDGTTSLSEAREAIETAAGQLACQNRTEQDLELLNQALFKRNRLLEQGKFSEYIQADLAFHQLIVACSKNPFLIRWYQEIFQELKLLLSGLVIDSSEYLDNTQQHQLMFDGIVNRDPELVVAAIIKNSQEKSS
jgi:GntR family transcriptional repressor for pyruvate dehydrogenase complex